MESSSFQQDKKTKITLISQKVDDILKKRWFSFVFLGILFLISLLIRLFFLKYYGGPLTGDAVEYGKIAWGIKNGYGLHWWAVIWPPFYPFLIFLFSLPAGSLETAAFVVSIFLGSLTVVPFFFLAKRIFNHQSAYLGSLLVVFFPALISISAVPLSEATYTFFLLLSILYGWFLIVRRSYLYAFLFGVLSGVCYLTRPEFLVAFGFILLLFVIIEIRRRPAKKSRSLVLLLLSFLGFLILAIPYIQFMHSQTGHWILSGKTSYNVLKQKAYSKSQDYFERRKAFAEMVEGLTPEGEVKGKVLLGEESILSFVTSPGYLRYYFKNARLGLKNINLFFLFFLLLSLFYIFSWKVDQEGWKKRVFLLCAFSPMISTPVFFIPAGRLIEPYSSILILLTANGILNVRKAMIKFFKHPESYSAITFGSLGILLAVIGLSIFSLVIATSWAKEYQEKETAGKSKHIGEEYKKLGLWADQILPKDAVVMFIAGDPFSFYCNRVAFPLPFAPFERIIEFAQKNKVDYLLVSIAQEAFWREDLSFLLEPLKDNPKVPKDSRLKLMDIYQAPSGLGAVMYKLVF